MAPVVQRHRCWQLLFLCVSLQKEEKQQLPLMLSLLGCNCQTITEARKFWVWDCGCLLLIIAVCNWLTVLYKTHCNQIPSTPPPPHPPTHTQAMHWKLWSLFQLCQQPHCIMQNISGIFTYFLHPVLSAANLQHRISLWSGSQVLILRENLVLFLLVQ